MGVLTREVNELFSLVTRAAPNQVAYFLLIASPYLPSLQGGVISGDNPATYLPTNPFRLWVIQLGEHT